MQNDHQQRNAATDTALSDTTRSRPESNGAVRFGERPTFPAGSRGAGSAPKPASAAGYPHAFALRDSPGLSEEDRRLRTMIRAKLRIGASGDRFEEEADRVAERVVSAGGGDPQLPRPISRSHLRISRMPISTPPIPTASRSAGIEGTVAKGIAEGGAHLREEVRSRMEEGMGEDFSDVKIHTGGSAAQSAQALNARAYTLGRDIVFGAGEFDTASREGRQLLAHELTHVAQQRGGDSAVVRRKEGDERYDAPRQIGPVIVLDVTLGTMRDRFRLTLDTQSATKALLGISSLRGDRSEVTKGIPIDFSSTAFPAVKSNVEEHATLRSAGSLAIVAATATSLQLDLTGDGVPDITLTDAASAGWRAGDWNHSVTVTGPGSATTTVGFSVTQNMREGKPFDLLELSAIGGAGDARGEGHAQDDHHARLDTKSVRVLGEQQKEGSYQDLLIGLEDSRVQARYDAYQQHLITERTYKAWSNLTMMMTSFRPALLQNDPSRITPVTQKAMAAAAEEFFQALKAETEGEHAILPQIVVPQSQGTPPAYVSSENPYTGENQIYTAFGVFNMGGDGPALSKDIGESDWKSALDRYDRLAFRLDEWVVEKLGRREGGASDKVKRQRAVAERDKALLDIEKHGPKRIQAVFYPDEKYRDQAGFVEEVPLDLYYWREGDTWHLLDLSNPSKPYPYEEAAAAGDIDIPPRIIRKLDDADHFVEGRIYYALPGRYSGTVQTKNGMTWQKFFSYLSLGLGVLGLALLAVGSLGAGSGFAAAGIYALAGSGLAGATSASIDLAKRADHGTLDATTFALDIAQIVAGLSGAGSLIGGRIVAMAATAPAGGRLVAGSMLGRLALLADQVYVPLLGVNIAADAVSIAAMTAQAAEQLKAIDEGTGTPDQKAHARRLLVAQLLLTGGLTVLAIRGSIKAFPRGIRLVVHPDYNGNPVISASLGKGSLIIDENISIALEKRQAGKPLQAGEQKMLDKVDELGYSDLRVTDPTVQHRGAKGRPMAEPGMAISVERTSKEYTDIIQVLEKANVGGGKGQNDREIIADAFFAVAEDGVMPKILTNDRNVFNKMALISGYNAAKAQPVAEAFPNGFDVTINGRTIRVIPVSNK